MDRQSGGGEAAAGPEQGDCAAHGGDGGRRGAGDALGDRVSRHDPVLCFVRLPWAWFSFVPCDDPVLAGRWWHETYDGDAGNPAWPSQVLRVAISPGGLLTPDMMARPLDMRLSPVEINASRGGWLFSTSGAVVAHAGMPLSAFREVMRERGADVYEPSWAGRPAFNPNDPAPGNVRLIPRGRERCRTASMCCST